VLSLFTFTYDRLLSGFQPKNSFYLSVYICADTLPLNLFRPKGTKRQKGHFSGHSPFISPHAKHEQMLVQLSVQFFRSFPSYSTTCLKVKHMHFFQTISPLRSQKSPSLLLCFFLSMSLSNVSQFLSCFFPPPRKLVNVSKGVIHSIHASMDI